ncbi:MAG: M48 family metallopeptidase, partial [Candidatus ainarchaeum sp.]|nr:M48 family metallopeptidase [Candidatus ainarchaeum sp.]
VEAVSISAGIPTPRTYVIEDSALNAFATGRDPENGVVCVTTGLMSKLNRQELEGVIAHEIAHIKNFDIRYMMLVTVLIGIITLLSDFLLRSFFYSSVSRNRENNQLTLLMIAVGFLLAILTPFVGYLVRMAMSRQREYLADATGANLTKYPKGLADALRKISQDSKPLSKINKASAHLFISNPFKKKSFISNLFSTHPPIEDRIDKLERM